MMKNDIALQVFTKANIPGVVKTRLIRDLGEVGASRIHQKLLDHAVGVAAETFPGNVELWVAGDLEHASICEQAQRYPLKVFAQAGGDLGDRMLHALRNGLESSHRVLLIGADAYSIDQHYLQLAVEKLREYDVVIGPAHDGGYILIGCNSTNEKMFENVAWGTENSLKNTLHSLRQCGMRYGLLPERWDIDTFTDIKSHAPQLLED